MKENFDKKNLIIMFNLGDKVMRKIDVDSKIKSSKFAANYDGPFIIIKINKKYSRATTYELQDTNGNIIRDVPPNHLKLVGEIEEVISSQTDKKGNVYYQCKFSEESIWLAKEYVPEDIIMKFDIHESIKNKLTLDDHLLTAVVGSKEELKETKKVKVVKRVDVEEEAFTKKRKRGRPKKVSLISTNSEQMEDFKPNKRVKLSN